MELRITNLSRGDERRRVRGFIRFMSNPSCVLHVEPWESGCERVASARVHGEEGFDKQVLVVLPVQFLIVMLDGSLIAPKPEQVVRGVEVIGIGGHDVAILRMSRRICADLTSCRVSCLSTALIRWSTFERRLMRGRGILKVP